MLKILVITLFILAPTWSAHPQMLREVSDLEKLKNGPPSVGIEGELEVVLPFPFTDLEVAPWSSTNLIELRIEKTEPQDGGFVYDFRYIGYEPGEHDLRDYLRSKDGKGADVVLPDLLKVKVISFLPENHDGSLIPTPLSEIPYLGGYWRKMTGVVMIWVGLGLAWVTYFRNGKGRS